MPRTRILVADMPRLQREIVTDLLRGEPDVEVVESSATPDGARAEAAHSQPELVILGHDDPRAVRDLLELLPRLVVLTVADRGLVAWRYGLTPYRERVGELSPAALTAGIHARENLPAWWTG